MSITHHPASELAQSLPSRRARDQVANTSAPAWAVEDLHASLADQMHDGESGHRVPRRDWLIEYLHGLHDKYGALYTPHLRALAAWMRLAEVQVYEVASFYHHFKVIKVGDEARPTWDLRPVVRVCDGLPCAMAGAAALKQQVTAQLADKAHVVNAPCVGRCHAAPVAVVHQNAMEHADAAMVARAVDERRLKAQQHADPVIHLAAYLQHGGYLRWLETVQGRRSTESIIAELEASHLRGLGGAGFPAGRKWRIVRDQAAPRLMAVNIDEGEPGTFKDRHYLERDPHRFIEGMLIAASVVGIDAIYLYLRDEYHGCRELLEQALAALRSHPELSRHLPKAIELRRGAGAYICGEESAMIESIEGKRGLPRQRPPYVAQVGLFGRPTLEHNFETLFWVREILERGGDWFAAQGRHGRKGLRSFSVSGRVKQPGMKLAPAGITLRELIDEQCGGMQDGHTLYAYLPGGASGGILPAALADVPLDFDTLQPHGAFIGSAAIVVLSQHDRAVDAARNLMAFFEHESCGQCAPCRAGTTKMRQLIERPTWDRALLAELSQVMRDASICGLGQAAPNPVDHVVRYFAHELT
jgi:formate dehydrogenase beta subunit